MYWLEIQCDIGAPDDKKLVRLHPPCHSHMNHNPAAGGRSLKDVKKNAEKDAIERRWKKTERGWVCPYCQTQTKRERVRL